MSARMEKLKKLGIKLENWEIDTLISKCDNGDGCINIDEFEKFVQE